MKEYEKLADDWFKKECEKTHTICIDARKAYQDGFLKVREMCVDMSLYHDDFWHENNLLIDKVFLKQLGEKEVDD
jgi:hypothetical protein